MIDRVFWMQVKVAWSKRCNVQLGDESVIISDSPPDELIDELDDYTL